MDAPAASPVPLEEIRRALAHGEILVHYQPVCERNGVLRGFEALLRWQHPTRGVLPPAAFAHALEDPELGVHLGDLALRHAVVQLRAWRDAGLDVGYVAVNLAAPQLARPAFVGEVVALLREHRLPTSALSLEVTESLYRDPRAAQFVGVLRAVRKAGISLALDDFGTGFASLARLKQFPIDRLKIDHAFVRDLGEHRFNFEVVRTIVALGHSLGMEVVAEGVETAAQLALLDELECDRVQGYCFAQPMAGEEATQFCRRPSGQRRAA